MATLYETPTGLAASSISSSRIDLSWADGSSAQIEVQRKPSDGTYATIDYVAAGEQSYIDTTCSANVNYYYRVRHNDGVDTSLWATSASAYSYPAVPTGLAVSFSGKTATLTWTNGSVYTYVGVYYKLTADSGWTTDTATLTGTLTTRDIAVSTESASYDFRIRGYNSNSALWSTYETESGQTSGVADPTNLLLTSASTTSVTATWTDNSSVEDGYEVYYDDTLFETTAADAETSTITGLTNDTTYTIKVRAKDGTAYSSYASDTITVGTIPDADAVIGAVTVVSHSSLAVAWTCTATNESGFTVYRSADGTTYTEIGTESSNATSYTDTGLTSYTLYYYKVRAYNSYGVSALSDAASGTTSIDLDSPTALIAEALSSTQIKLTFTVNAGDATRHNVERKTTGSYSALGVTADGTTATYTDGTCSANTEYTYRIRAYSSVSGTYGDYSTPVTKTTLNLGTSAVSTRDSYFALGSNLYVADTAPHTSFAAYWTSKPIDFGEISPEDADKFKTVDLVQLEYVDKYSSVPVVVSLSNNGGLTWTTASASIGVGDDADHVANFYFKPGVTGKQITLKVSSTDDDTTFIWTGMVVYYIARGEYFDVSQPATSWDGGEFGTVQLYEIDGGGW